MTMQLSYVENFEYIDVYIVLYIEVCIIYLCIFYTSILN